MTCMSHHVAQQAESLEQSNAWKQDQIRLCKDCDEVPVVTGWRTVCDVCTCSFPHLGEDKGSNLTRGVALTAGLNPCITIGVLDDLEWDHLQHSMQVTQCVLDNISRSDLQQETCCSVQKQL